MYRGLGFISIVWRILKHWLKKPGGTLHPLNMRASNTLISVPSPRSWKIILYAQFRIIVTWCLAFTYKFCVESMTVTKRRNGGKIKYIRIDINILQNVLNYSCGGKFPWRAPTSPPNWVFSSSDRREWEAYDRDCLSSVVNQGLASRSAPPHPGSASPFLPCRGRQSHVRLLEWYKQYCTYCIRT